MVIRLTKRMDKLLKLTNILAITRYFNNNIVCISANNYELYNQLWIHKKYKIINHITENAHIYGAIKYSVINDALLQTQLDKDTIEESKTFTDIRFSNHYLIIKIIEAHIIANGANDEELFSLFNIEALNRVHRYDTNSYFKSYIRFLDRVACQKQSFNFYESYISKYPTKDITYNYNYVLFLSLKHKNDNHTFGALASNYENRYGEIDVHFNPTFGNDELDMRDNLHVDTGYLVFAALYTGKIEAAKLLVSRYKFPLKAGATDSELEKYTSDNRPVFSFELFYELNPNIQYAETPFGDNDPAVVMKNWLYFKFETGYSIDIHANDDYIMDLYGDDYECVMMLYFYDTGYKKNYSITKEEMYELMPIDMPTPKPTYWKHIFASVIKFQTNFSANFCN